ncbi:MAG: response regulator [Spirochaetales bacterium]|jgi:DNA-binding response OmpR family regulator|nr:response regulator [Exilispira sp.]NMC67171.1 response regulator [Spirochaetales bacterium]
MKSILIIDDSEDLLNLLKYAFEAKYKVFTCPSGRKGLYSLLNNNPDIILLDIMMQGLNGFDVLKLLRTDQYTKNKPIFIISALVEDTVIERCKEMGANGFIKKPFQIQKLREFVDNYLEGGSTTKTFQVLES